MRKKEQRVEGQQKILEAKCDLEKAQILVEADQIESNQQLM